MAESMPIGRIFTTLADQDPSRPSVTCGSETISRLELERNANRLARAYAELGVKQGDFVTIGLPNSIEFYEATIATWKLGAVPQPVSAKLPARERQAIVDLAQPTIVVGADQADHPGHVCIAAGFAPDSALADDPLPDAVAPSWKAPTSGGSTGRPKLIVAGQEGKLDPDLISSVFRMDRDDTHLVPGPLYHNAPFSLSTVGLFMGHHLVVLPKFDAEAALAAIDEHRVQWMNLVPTMMLRMHRVVQADPDRYDLSSLRVVWHMAAPCPEWLKEAWIELVGPDTLMELYGGTEGQASTIITGTEWLTHRGSVGKPLTGQMKVLDAEGNTVPAGEIGEIYMRRFDGTAPTYRYIGAEPRELDGWESLGDMGWMDAEGYVYLSDRRTDMILSGGANIYPAEVEAAIDEHPHVLSSLVVGIPDEDLGQRVHAIVQPDGEVTVDDLLAHLNERLVRYKIPRSFEFVDEPLRDDAGKARRTAVRDAAVERLRGA
jgi:bile acid-coenzyme A ligase